MTSFFEIWYKEKLVDDQKYSCLISTKNGAFCITLVEKEIRKEKHIFITDVHQYGSKP